MAEYSTEIILSVGGFLLGFGITFVIYWFRLQSVKREMDERNEMRLVAVETESDTNIMHLSEALDSARQELQTQTAANSQLSSIVDELKCDNAVLTEKANSLLELKKQLEQQKQREVDLHHELSTIQVAKAKLETQLIEEKRNHEEKLRLLKDAKEQLTRDFENLANKIFDSKHEVFKRQSQSSIELTLNPLRDQLKRFKQKVEDVYEKENNQRLSLLHEITHLKALNQRMSEEAVNLTRALKGEKKTQGNWGEVILERVLEESGLRKGREYETQVSLKSEDGKKRQPDVVIRLPDNRDIIVDAKVSLVDYEKYCSSEDDEEKQCALRAHIEALRHHVRRLSVKDYANLEAIRSLDFVFIFVPIESAFLTAVEFDQDLFREAYQKNIIVVSPTTLLATLRTVESIWRYEKQSKYAAEIARQAGALHDQVCLVVEALHDIGKHLDRAQTAYGNTYNRLAQGRGNLISRTVNLEKLGAKAKKVLPTSVLEVAELEDEAGEPNLSIDPLVEAGRDEDLVVERATPTDLAESVD